MTDRSIQGELSFNTVAQCYPEGQGFIKLYPSLELDLAGVTACDSAGLVLLLAWMRDAKRANKKLYFINIPQKLLDIASMSGLKEFLLSSC